MSCTLFTLIKIKDLVFVTVFPVYFLNDWCAFNLKQAKLNNKYYIMAKKTCHWQIISVMKNKERWPTNTKDLHKQVSIFIQHRRGKKVDKRKRKPLYSQSTPPMLQVTLCSRARRGRWSSSGVYTWPSYRPRLVSFNIPILPQVLWI